MENLRIRQAIVSEQRAIEEVSRRAGLNNAGDREALLAHPEAIEVPLRQIVKGQVFVAELNGEIVGGYSIEPRPDGDVELDGLFVEPRLQRLGVGRRLLEHCTAVAGKDGALALHVIGNPHSMEFSIALGFVTTGTTETQFGTGLLMRKAL